MRNLVVLGSIVVSSSLLASGARADEGTAAQAFVEQERHQLEQLLHQPDTAARNSQIHQAMASFFDYDELTRRAFGSPCPGTEPECHVLWTGYDDAKRVELRSLLEQLVPKTYQRNLAKTLDYDISYLGARAAAGDTRVVTDAKNRLKPREAAIRVEYIVKATPKGPRVVDIVTEGSSLTKNYYDQFRKMMDDPNGGYPNIVQKLTDKIAALP